MENSSLKKPNATNEVRQALVVFLAQHHENGRLNRGAIAKAMELFPFKRTQIKQIWRLARDNVINPNVEVDYSTQKKGNSGRKRKYSQEDFMAAIRQTPLSHRQTLRTLSNATSIPASTLCRMLRREGRLPVAIKCSLLLSRNQFKYANHVCFKTHKT